MATDEVQDASDFYWLELDNQILVRYTWALDMLSDSDV